MGELEKRTVEDEARYEVAVFVNAENLTDVRQTNSLIPPDRGVDGRWTVDAWARVDGPCDQRGCEAGSGIDASLNPANSW